ncbi:MAG TPA: hypothetical protein VI935_02570 [Thermodesulfobacteriota bacterium]|nr:hypothetical protein [Thermodesulfobacteriota bacterium]
MINKQLRIARREWENIRQSLEMCGDIGDFNPEDLRNSIWFIGQEYEGFISNIIDMDEKFSQCGYGTSDALNVLTKFASVAAEKLGFKEELASAFGMGYGFVRTGLLAYDKLEPRQILFCKMFYPLGVNFKWDFNPSMVKTKLKIVFEKFRSWQNNPQLYTQDFAQSQKMGEIWKGCNEVNQ